LVSKKPPIKLGLIGISEGNGHPYSWGAIINGYNKQLMSKCPYPVIPEYLKNANSNRIGSLGCKVTHLWTQDKQESVKIANACKIGNIVDDPTEMLGKIDGLLLARDDCENHFNLSKDFLSAGYPIYIDKPIASFKKQLDKILSLRKYPHQIFSCSALGYAPELEISEEMRQEFGNPISVEAITPKFWNKYGIHLIEPILNMLRIVEVPREVYTKKENGLHTTHCSWNSGKKASMTCSGKISNPIEFRVTFENGKKIFQFKDSFTAFRNALEKFVITMKTGVNGICEKKIQVIVDILERGQ
jgi:hypothetical protein